MTFTLSYVEGSVERAEATESAAMTTEEFPTEDAALSRGWEVQSGNYTALKIRDTDTDKVLDETHIRAFGDGQ